MKILYEEMQNTNRKTPGIFNSTLRFDPEGISFCPDDKEIAESL
jgi:hypothetical protein